MSGAALDRISCIQVSLTGWLSSSRAHDYIDAIIAPRSSASTSVTSKLLVEELIAVSGSGACVTEDAFRDKYAVWGVKHRTGQPAMLM